MFRIVIQIETSGGRSYNGCIMEAAAVVLDEHLEETAHFQTLSHPGEEALSGTVQEALNEAGPGQDVFRTAPPENEAARALRAFLARFYGATLHSFRNEFALRFLAREPWCIPAGSWGECVLRASLRMMVDAGALENNQEGKLRRPTLDEAARFFDVPQREGHRALGGARAASRVLARIIRKRSEEDAFEDEARMIIEDGL